MHESITAFDSFIGFKNRIDKFVMVELPSFNRYEIQTTINVYCIGMHATALHCKKGWRNKRLILKKYTETGELNVEAN